MRILYEKYIHIKFPERLISMLSVGSVILRYQLFKLTRAWMIARLRNALGLLPFNFLPGPRVSIYRVRMPGGVKIALQNFQVPILHAFHRQHHHAVRGKTPV
jgi:hypothetical protein